MTIKEVATILGVDYGRTRELVKEKIVRHTPGSDELVHVGDDAQAKKVDNTNLRALQKASMEFWMGNCKNIDGKKEVRVRSSAGYMELADYLFEDDPDNPTYINIKTMETSASDLRQPFLDRCMYSLFKSGKYVVGNSIANIFFTVVPCFRYWSSH